MLNTLFYQKTVLLPVFFLLAACNQTAASHPVADEVWIEAGDGAVFTEEEVYSETYVIESQEYIENTFSVNLPKTKALDPAAVLAAHNRWRSAAGVPSLSWSDDLAKTAQNWADYLSSSGCLIQHSNSGYGENILQGGAIVWSSGRTEIKKKTVAEVVDGWAGEIEDYDYTSNSCASLCGHYTQIVWRTTKEVGCGMSICPDHKQIWVCHYDPTGNVAGQRPY